jgi:CRP-like cAMP-binding protein
MMRLMSHNYGAGEKIPLHPSILWRIQTGLVHIVTVEGGQTITLAILGVGEMFGEALSDASPCYAICLTPVKLAVLPMCLCQYLLFAENLYRGRAIS